MLASPPLPALRPRSRRAHLRRSQPADASPSPDAPQLAALLAAPPPGAACDTWQAVVETGPSRSDELDEPTSALHILALHATGTTAVLVRDAWSGAARGARGATDRLTLRLPPGFGLPSALLLAAERGPWRPVSARLTADGGALDGSPPSRYQADGGGGSGAVRLSLVVPDPEPLVSAAKKAAVREAGMAAYGSLKALLVGVSAALAVPGAALAQYTGGAAVTLPYLAGASVGLLYLAALQRSVDALPAASEAPASQEPEPPLNALTATGAQFRLAFLAAAGIAGGRLLAGGLDGDGLADPAALVVLRAQLVAGVAGFLTHRVAVLGVGLGTQGRKEE